MTALADQPGAALHPRRTQRAPQIAGWALVVAGLAVATVVWNHLTHAHPSYDAYGWMVWGHQTLYGHLSTSAAPSWKPLPYLFDLPYALFGRDQLHLWTFTASFLGLSGGIFAFRIAFRLSAPDGGYASAWRAWPSVVAGALGAGAMFALYGIWHQLLITNTDPIVVMFCLAAVDAHLSGHRRLALFALLGASYGRPEAWGLLFLYGLWLGWRPGHRRLVAGVFLLIPLGWFLVPGLSSPTFFQAGQAALGFRTAITHGNRFNPVINRIHSLYDPACWYVISAAGIRALVTWNRRWMMLFAAAAVWILTEVGFAYHDWPAAPRYLMEPAALLGVLGAAFAGIGLRTVVEPRPGLRWDWALRVGALIGVIAAAAALIPFGIGRIGALRHDSRYEAYVTRELDTLAATVVRVGGARHLLACAPALTEGGDQSAVAWEVGRNVDQVGYKPSRDLRHDLARVYIRPGNHPTVFWPVTAVNVGPRAISRCAPIPVRLAPTNHARYLAYVRHERAVRRHRLALSGASVHRLRRHRHTPSGGSVHRRRRHHDRGRARHA